LGTQPHKDFREITTSSTNKYESQYFVYSSSNFRVAVLPGIRIAPSSSNKVRKLGVVAGVPLIAALCGVPGLVFKVMMCVWQATIFCQVQGGRVMV
jgi:hypothetical protein